MPDYQMKDLGYQRTPTSARLVVTFSDGTAWAVPVQVIADSRDAYYAPDGEDTYGFILRGELDQYEILDWATNNVNWSDVREWAEQLPTRPDAADYQREWPNAKMDISTRSA